MARIELDPTDSADRELIFAIGRVAVAAARLEEELRFTLSEIIGGDRFWIIAEGQSVDWLINYLKLIIAEEIEEFELWSSSPAASDLSDWRRRFIRYLEAVSRLVPKVQPLRDRRNIVVHGVWYRNCLFSRECDESCSDSPYGAPARDVITYHVDRSRMRRASSRQRWSIPQVERLADELAEIESELCQERWARMNASLHDAIAERDASGGGAPAPG